MSEPLEERLDKLANENHPTRRPSTEGAIIREVALECLAEIRRQRGEISRLDILAQRHANEVSHLKKENERLLVRAQAAEVLLDDTAQALASAREVLQRLTDAAYEAIDHVGYANYAEREREAREMIRKIVEEVSHE